MADWMVEPGGLPTPARRKPDNDWQFDAPRGDELERIRWFIERLSHWMDARFEVPGVGWRFGLDALVGLVPGIGDVATTLVSLYIIGLAGRFGLPRITIARMALNVAIDMLIGALPLVGDLFDVWWKANQRNAMLLSERLADQAIGSRGSKATDWLFVGLMLVGLVALFAAVVALAVFVFAAVWSVLANLFQER